MPFYIHGSFKIKLVSLTEEISEYLLENDIGWSCRIDPFERLSS